jgi:hypothetical protein
MQKISKKPSALRFEYFQSQWKAAAEDAKQIGKKGQAHSTAQQADFAAIEASRPKRSSEALDQGQELETSRKARFTSANTNMREALF